MNSYVTVKVSSETESVAWPAMSKGVPVALTAAVAELEKTVVNLSEILPLM